MEEVLVNGKELSHLAHANGMNETYKQFNSQEQSLYGKTAYNTHVI